MPISRRNFVELCERLTVEDEKAFEDLWRRLGLSVDWAHDLPDHRRTRSARVAAGVPAQPRAGRGLPGRGADAVGRHVPHGGRAGRARGPRARRARTTGSPSTRPTASRVFIETTRPELLAACVALVAHPDDERYQPLFGSTVRTPLFGVEVPVLAHRLADPEKGSGIAMICTFGDITDVTWWRELQLPDPPDHRLGRPHPARDARVDRDRRRPRAVRRARGQDVVHGQGAHRRAARASPASSRASPADRAPGEVLREGRQAARDRHHPPVVHPQRRPRGRPARAPRRSAAPSCTGTRRTCRRATTTGSRASTATGSITRQRFFGVPFPVWYRLDERRRCPSTTSRCSPTRTRCRSTRRSDVPDGLRRGPARRSRAASSATPTSWTPGPRRRCRRRSPAAGATTTTSSAAALPHGPAPAGARDHPHLAVLHGRARAPRGRRRCRGSTRRSAAGSSTPTARRCAKSKGNVVTPIDLLDQHGADAVRYWAAAGRPGTDTAFDEGQMKIGRRLAIKILNVSQVRARARRRAARPTRRSSPTRSTARCSPQLGRRRRATPPRPSTTTTTRAPSSSPSRSSGRSATTTSSW